MIKINKISNNLSEKQRQTKGFTLAEALITLIIIGVASVLVLPALRAGIKDKTLEEQQKVVYEKIQQGFVYNLEKVSTSDQIDIQFPTPSDVIGLVFNDGVRALIAYNTDCIMTNQYDQDADVTECFAMYYDVDGSNSSSIMGEDIVSFNTGTTPAEEWDIGEVFTPGTYTIDQCRDAKAAGAPIDACIGSNNIDRWSNATYKCFKQGKRLPTAAELKALAASIYDEPIALSGTTNVSGIANKELAAKIGITDAGVSFWASDTDGSGNSASIRSFATSSTNGGGSSRHVHVSSSIKAFCL